MGFVRIAANTLKPLRHHAQFRWKKLTGNQVLQMSSFVYFPKSELRPTVDILIGYFLFKDTIFYLKISMEYLAFQ